MNPKEYLENVLKTESINFDSIRSRMQDKFVIRLDHVSDGLCTEAGEFKDQLKKFKFYGRDLDLINLVEELGDTLWYVGIACNVLGITMEEVMERNIAKLRARYEGKFSETKAEDRDLVKEREILETEELYNNLVTHFAFTPNSKAICGSEEGSITSKAERVTCKKCNTIMEGELNEH